MPKLKPHKGLLKRVKVTGKGRVKFRRSFSGHLMSHKSGERCQKLRKSRLAKSSDIKRLERMLHRPLKGGDSNR
ncbi:MAG: 50S ribosomal protein L35 [Phycisphaeraceae bacterium]|nr:50S ribosomal protein L35 [Phycisphaeraceae bacterium]